MWIVISTFKTSHNHAFYNSYKRFSLTNSPNPRQRVPLNQCNQSEVGRENSLVEFWTDLNWYRSLILHTGDLTKMMLA